MPPYALICPSTRGLSLALTRHLLRTTTLPVFATHRYDAGSEDDAKSHILDGLHEHSSMGGGEGNMRDRLHLLKLDLTNEASVKSAAERMGEVVGSKEFGSVGATRDGGDSGTTLSELRENHQSPPSPFDGSNNNGGGGGGDNTYLYRAYLTGGILHPEKHPKDLDLASIEESFRINVFGHMLLIKHFSPFLPRRPPPSPPSPPSESHPSPSSSSHSTSNANTGNEDGDTMDSDGTLQSSDTGSATASENGNAGGGARGGGATDIAKWVHISARVGSISDNNKLGGWYSYRASKAALNQIIKTFDLHLKANTSATPSSSSHSENHSAQETAHSAAMCVGIHPGTMRTDLSRGYWDTTANSAQGRLFSPQDAAKNVIGVVDALGEDQRGRVWDWKGEEVLP